MQLWPKRGCRFCDSLRQVGHTSHLNVPLTDQASRRGRATLQTPSQSSLRCRCGLPSECTQGAHPYQSCIKETVSPICPFLFLYRERPANNQTDVRYGTASGHSAPFVSLSVFQVPSCARVYLSTRTDRWQATARVCHWPKDLSWVAFAGDIKVRIGSTAHQLALLWRIVLPALGIRNDRYDPRREERANCRSILRTMAFKRAESR
jgi:hypothetical protein